MKGLISLTKSWLSLHYALVLSLEFTKVTFLVIRAGIVEHAEELLGVRYKYGGNRPREGFDCSGLTRYLYQNAGLDLPSTSEVLASVVRMCL